MSSFGRLKTLSGGKRFGGVKIIYQRQCKRGYLLAGLYKNRKEKKCLVHRLVGIAFIPNPEKMPQINHKKGIQVDNRYWELEWSNNSKNHKHAYDVLGRVPHRLGKKGKLHGKSKPIKQLSLLGIEIATFESMNIAAMALKMSCGNLCGALKGRHKTAGGYKWQYIDQNTK